MLSGGQLFYVLGLIFVGVILALIVKSKLE